MSVMSVTLRSRLLILVLSLLLVSLVVLIGLGPELREGIVHNFRDGTPVYLKEVTYGKFHRATRNMYGFRLPIPREKYDLETGKTALVFWIFVEPKEGRGFDVANWDTYDTVLDEHGCWISQGESKSQTFGPVKRPWVPVSLISVRPVIVEAFPRRGTKLILRLTDANGVEPTMEFETENPSPGTFPVWKPDALPISRTDQDVTLILSELSVDRAAPSQTRPEGLGLRWTRARFEVRENSVESSAWTPTEITIADATGNEVNNLADHLELRAEADRKRPGQISLEIKKGLCPLESAWKVRVKLVKASGATRVFEFLVKASPR